MSFPLPPFSLGQTAKSVPDFHFGSEVAGGNVISEEKFVVGTSLF